MKTKIFVSGMVALWLANAVCFAEGQLDRSDVLNILQTLTAEPHKTWIPVGTIVATHEESKAAATKDPNEIEANITAAVREFQSGSEQTMLSDDDRKMQLDAIPFNVRYKLANEYTMTSNVVVRFDGERFYWKTDIQSRTDSVKPDLDLAGNFMTDQFDLNGNRGRIFAWDGETYSTYALPVNNAIVKEAAKVNVPRVVNGPLTAGFIPWGFGNYSYEKLSSAASSAAETSIGCQKQIQLTLTHPNGSLMAFTIDPDKNYAVLSHSVTKTDGSIAVNTYGNFLHIGGRWIPTTIMLEQYKNFVAPQNLAASDLWNFTSVTTDALAEDSFKITYETDTLVEYYNTITAKPVMYRYSKNGVDTDSLLIDKLEVDAAGSRQNCAMAAMKYVAAKLGKTITNQQLASLPQNADGKTSLYALRQYAQGLGLFCRAVKADLQTLKGLTGCQAILHIPGKDHYVVLGTIDDTYVRIIDLSSRKFFERFRTYEFGWEWSEGTTLLISDQPINVIGTAVDLDD
ncbi:MAG: cysteine peptidase family C39 domain-containing protein, partial [Sedimentisphaerales bacterium]|nr:cysteine peptidase family C39 domain-containing protein [Sedimentisphaerales bacterium]